MTARSPSPPRSWATPKESVERWALVTARDIMRKSVVTISPTSRLNEIQEIFADNRISGAPVVDDNGEVLGIVSLKDLVERYTEDDDARPARRSRSYEEAGGDIFDEGVEPVASSEDADEEPVLDDQSEELAETTAQDIMSAQVHSVAASAGLKEIAALMTRHKVHRVLVHDGGRHVGLISTLEILDALCA